MAKAVSIVAPVEITKAHLIDEHVEQGRYEKAKRVHIIFGPMVYCIFKFIPVFLAVYIGNDFINSIVNAIPEFVSSGISLGANMISFYGFALLLSTMISKKTAVFFFLGFVIAAYSGLGLTAIAIISILSAIVLYQVKYDEVAGDTVDELDDL